jgi:hypothetical protein
MTNRQKNQLSVVFLLYAAMVIGFALYITWPHLYIIGKLPDLSGAPTLSRKM